MAAGVTAKAHSFATALRNWFHWPHVNAIFGPEGAFLRRRCGAPLVDGQLAGGSLADQPPSTAWIDIDWV